MKYSIKLNARVMRVKRFRISKKTVRKNCSSIGARIKKRQILNLCRDSDFVFRVNLALNPYPPTSRLMI